MKKVVLYPYNLDSISVYKNRNRQKEYIIDGIVVSEKERKYNLNSYADDISVIEENELLSNNTDILVLCDNINCFDLRNFEKQIEMAKKYGIDLFATKEFALKYPFIIEDNLKTIDNVHPLSMNYSNKLLLELDTPICIILGQGNNCDKFNLLITLTEIIKTRGYKPSVVSSNSLGSFFGMYSYPDYMFSDEFSFCEKIQFLNRYFYDIEKTDNPDIIVISVPGGIMPLDPVTHNNYGEFAHIVSYAVPSMIDIGILNIYDNEVIDPEYIDYLKQICKIRFNIEIQMIVQAKQSFGYDDEAKTTSFFFRNALKSNNYDSEQTASAFNVLIDELENHIDVL